jgi:hypothetical protein
MECILKLGDCFFFSSVFMYFLFELYNINGKKLRILESVARFLNMG